MKNSPTTLMKWVQVVYKNSMLVKGPNQKVNTTNRKVFLPFACVNSDHQFQSCKTNQDNIWCVSDASKWCQVWSIYMCPWRSNFLTRADLNFCAEVGFTLKIIFLLEQIKLFQQLEGSSLDEEGFPKDGIALWAAKGGFENYLFNNAFWNSPLKEIILDTIKWKWLNDGFQYIRIW